MRDGRAILFLALVGDHADVLRVRLTGGEPEFVMRGTESGAADCGAGRLVFVRSAGRDNPSGRLVVRDADGTERDLVRFPADEDVRYFRCDRAGTRVVYTLARDRNIALHGRSDIGMIGLDGSGARSLTEDGQENSSATFHPDGRSIVFSSKRGGRNNLWELPLSGGPPAQLSFGEGPDMAPDIAPDGQTIVFDIDVTIAPIVAYGAGGARRRLTSVAEETEALAVASDGRDLVAAVRRGGADHVVIVPTGGGEERTLAEGQTPRFTLDGTEVVYVVPGTPTRISAIARAGAASRRVGELSGQVADLNVGPDGSIHVALLGAGGLEAWRIPLSGGPGEREAPAPWSEVVPAPTGGWRAALVHEVGPWFSAHLFAPGARLEDPAARTIRARSAAWDWDGASVVYYDGVEVHRLDLATGTDAAIAKPVGDGRSLAVSPDRQTVFLSEYVSHVRRQLITNYGERPRPP